MFFRKRQNNDNDTIEEVNITNQINDGYLEELEKKFSNTLNEQYDEDFTLSTKCKILVGISTVAIAMLLMVIIFIVMSSEMPEVEPPVVPMKVSWDSAHRTALEPLPARS